MNEAKPWSPWRRKIVSVLLLLHVIAIVAAPMSGPPPASDLSRRVASIFDPYLRAAFLGHGYRFFAPNPGPSHLVRYEIKRADGTTESHRFPDTKEQWPRLYYHRHFMVAEQVNQLVSIPTDQEFSADLREREQMVAELRQEGNGVLARSMEQALFEDRAAFERQRKLRDGLLDGIAQYFLRFHDAESIRVYSVRHPIPAPSEVEAGFQLGDPDSYLERLVYQLPREEISTEELP